MTYLRHNVQLEYSSVSPDVTILKIWCLLLCHVFLQLSYNSSFGVYVILMNLFSLKQDKERSEWTENRVRQSLLTYTSTMYSRCFKSIQYLNLYWIPVAECSYFYSSTVRKYKFEVLKCSFHVVLALVECALWLCSYPLTPPFWLCHSASWQASVADTAAHAHTHTLRKKSIIDDFI